ncbi:Uncharacterized protein dnm_008010 [Desulfonema magnum]|uniref:Uncharacterized protein n=1 Tax=Desulfonema magnum TaxID=45655 RepID=A0A975BG85_9BACT|nr:Uncharacterized protein dnm_008010 [Desulfonema magnum]
MNTESQGKSQISNNFHINGHDLRSQRTMKAGRPLAPCPLPLS